MAIQMQQIVNLLRDFSQIGREHVKMGEGGAVVQATSSLGGRIVNWCRATFSNKEATANREIINRVLDSIKDADGMGDKFATIARTDFARNLSSGRPISGMKVAEVLDRVVYLAKDEQERQASFKSNSQSILTDMKSEFVQKKGVLFDAVSENLKTFGYPADLVDDAFMAKVEKDLVTQFTRLAIKNDANVTPEQVRNICSEAARMTIIKATRDNSECVTAPLCDISSPTASLPSRVNELKLEAGIKSDIPLDSLNKLSNKVMGKIANCALRESQQTTPQRAQAEVDKHIKEFLAGIKAIEDCTDITEAEKTILTKLVINDADIFTKDMTVACTKSLHSACDLLDMFKQKDISLAVLKDGIDKMTSDFNSALIITDSNGESVENPDIGGDQVMSMYSVVVSAYMNIRDFGALEQTPDILNKISQLTRSLKDDYKLTAGILEQHPELSLPKEQRVELLAKLKIEDERLTKSIMFIKDSLSVGGALNQFRYEAHNSEDAALTSQDYAISNILFLINQFTPVRTQEQRNVLINTFGLGNLTMDQAREFMPTGHGQFGTLDMPKALDYLTKECNKTFDKEKKIIAAAPKEPLRADSSLEQKMQYFSAQFLSDLWRNGIMLDGEYFPGEGSNNKAAMENILDKVIAFFPDIETASLTSCGLHQSLGADALTAIGADPATGQSADMFATIEIPAIADKMILSIIDNSGGNYSVSISVSKQKAGESGTLGMNIQSSYDLNVNMANGTVAVKATDFDYILS